MCRERANGIRASVAVTTVLAISIRTARPIQVHLPALRPAHHARDVEAEETVEQRGAHADASVNPPEPADRATHPGDVHVIRGEHGRHGIVCKRVEEEEGLSRGLRFADARGMRSVRSACAPRASGSQGTLRSPGRSEPCLRRGKRRRRSSELAFIAVDAFDGAKLGGARPGQESLHMRVLVRILAGRSPAPGGSRLAGRSESREQGVGPHRSSQLAGSVAALAQPRYRIPTPHAARRGRRPPRRVAQREYR